MVSININKVIGSYIASHKSGISLDLAFDKEEYPMLWFGTLDNGKDSGFSMSGDSSAGELRVLAYTSDVCICKSYIFH